MQAERTIAIDTGVFAQERKNQITTYLILAIFGIPIIEKNHS